MRHLFSVVFFFGFLGCSEPHQATSGVSNPALADISFSTWREAEPASLGLIDKPLLDIHADINAGQYGWIDSLLVIRHGQIAFEQYYKHDYGEIYGEAARTPGPLVFQSPSGPYNYFNAFWHPYYKGGELHSMQSVTKSIVSAVVGIAIQRGDFPSLDTPVMSFFDVNTVLHIDDAKHAMTLRDLLTMSAGLSWDEGMPYSDPRNTFTVMARALDWVQYTLDQPMSDQPGTHFNYNSGASLILGEIFLRATGIDIEVYAQEHLFQPIGIRNYAWKRTPSGLADTQEGLFLSTRDLAKIAYLFLQKGQWNGVEIVPEDWVRNSLEPAFELGDEDGTGYGYKWWSQSYQLGDEDYVAYLGKGFGGQRPIILPDLDMVVVVTGWNILPNRPFFTATEIIERVLLAVEK